MIQEWRGNCDSWRKLPSKKEKKSRKQKLVRIAFEPSLINKEVRKLRF